jgi:hypothetical protein
LLSWHSQENIRIYEKTASHAWAPLVQSLDLEKKLTILQTTKLNAYATDHVISPESEKDCVACLCTGIVDTIFVLLLL